MILGGVRATATANEEYHSTLGFLSRKHRSLIFPGRLELLSLGRAFMQEEARNAKAALLAIQARTAVDGFFDDDDVREAAAAMGLAGLYAEGKEEGEGEEGKEEGEGEGEEGEVGAAVAAGAGQQLVVVDDDMA